MSIKLVGEYAIWKNMRARCKNPSNPAFVDYGGRGISVCTRWESFHNFREDMGEKPSKHHSLDRIDNDGNYCPENCKWSTWVEQANNRRGNTIIRYAGITKPVGEWAEWLRVPKWYLYRYTSRLGASWAIRKALKYDAKITKTNTLVRPRNRPKWTPKNYQPEETL